MAGLTDEQMAQLEAQQPKQGLTDEQMSQLEAQHGPPQAAPQKYESPGVDPNAGVMSNAMARLKDPNQWHALLNNEGPAKQDVVQGSAPLAIPAGAAPAAIQALAGLLGKSGVLPSLARIGTNAALGAAQGGYSGGVQGAKTGALVGGGLGAAGELVGAAGGLLKRAGGNTARMNPAQTEAYATSPKTTFNENSGFAHVDPVNDMRQQLADPYRTNELEDSAKNVIQNSRSQLRANGLQRAGLLKEYLQGKQVAVNPAELEGVDPRIDEILHTTRGRSLVDPPSGAPQEDTGLASFKNLINPQPESLNLDANDANTIKRALQEKASFGQGTILDPVQQAKNSEMAGKASALRSQLENAGGEDVARINQEMQQGTLMSSALRKGLKNPLAFVGSEAPGRVATMARAEDAGAGGLIDFGNQLGAAKALHAKDVGSGVMSWPMKMAGRAGIKAGHALQSTPAADPMFINQVVKSLFDQSR